MLEGVDMPTLKIEQIQPSIMEETFNNVGKGFQEVLDNLERINSRQAISAGDSLAIQQSLFHYNMYQETVTKIASKSANAINEVMKAQ